MRVGVLGGGLLGCCIALVLAERGVRVSLYERNEKLLNGAATANQGKIHLGYSYGGDRTLATARTMIKGALSFSPLIQRYLGIPAQRIGVALRSTYLVHRDSLQSVDNLTGYFLAVHKLVAEAAAGHEDTYFGVDLRAPLRRWSGIEQDHHFDAEYVKAAFDTPETAVETLGLAEAVRARINETSLIEVYTRHTVTAVDEDGTRLRVTSDGPEDAGRESYDHVVNALWDGRLALDANRGLNLQRQWLHRFKYGIRFRKPDICNTLPNATVVSGPFGHVASYQNGFAFMSWYPACMRGMSKGISPPDLPATPPEPMHAQILTESLRGLGDLMPILRELHPADLRDVTVKGAVMLAPATTDVDDPESELHRRDNVGVVSVGSYHTVDPGKLTLVPYYAQVCADRIYQ